MAFKILKLTETPKSLKVSKKIQAQQKGRHPDCGSITTEKGSTALPAAEAWPEG